MEYLKEIENRIENKLNDFLFEKNNKETREKIAQVLKEELSDVNEFIVICDDTNNPEIVRKENIFIADVALKYHDIFYINRITVSKIGKFYSNFSNV